LVLRAHPVKIVLFQWFLVSHANEAIHVEEEELGDGAGSNPRIWRQLAFIIGGELVRSTTATHFVAC
jgi:hypothetical protein